MNIKSDWLNSKNLTLGLVGMIIAYFSVTNLVESRFGEIELNIRSQIAEQQVLLSTIAEITARNGADAVTESIVRDCAVTERSQFNTLLGSLNNGLSHIQLVELERLFGRCGSFSSDRKSVMVTRLFRETEIYKNYVKQLSIVVQEDVSTTYQVEKWTVLATEERRQSELFRELVALQDRIISSLLDGNVITSPELIGILQEVKEVKDELIFTNQKVTSVRTELIAL